MERQFFSIRGMAMDFDEAVSPSQYACEIRNMRIDPTADSPMLALSTERSNAPFVLTDGSDAIAGSIVGHCVLNRYLVLFTCEMSGETHVCDRIYKCEEVADKLDCRCMYTGNLGFSETTDIEALGIYENDMVMKVYWIDGEHQPRVINIGADSATVTSWETKTDPFDFVPVMSLNENVEVTKKNYGGVFGAGTVQYVIDYYNKYGQKSNIAYTTPIQYVSPSDRGGSPEERVSNSFLVKVSNPDRNFEYMRVRSVFRSSENGPVECRIVKTIPLSEAVSVEKTKKSVIFFDRSFTADTQTQDQRIKIVDVTTGRDMPLGVFISDASRYEVNSGITVTSSPFTVTNTGYVLYVYTGIFESGIEKVVRYRCWIPQSMTGSTYGVKFTATQTVDNGYIVYNVVSSDGGDYSSIGFTGDMEVSYYEDELSVIDSGFGETADSSDIFESMCIAPGAMAEKSNTLFFGNYKDLYKEISDADKDSILVDTTVIFTPKTEPMPTGDTGNFYSYDSTLDGSASQITTFKGGESYRFGLILQDDRGIWSSVVDLGKYRNNVYPINSQNNVYLVQAVLKFGDNAKQVIAKYRRMKAVVLENNMPEVLAQGVLCPTVFNKKRENNAPYAQSSWFFRTVTDTELAPGRPQNVNFRSIVNSSSSAIGEVQGSSETSIDYYSLDTNGRNALSDNDMFVDWNTLTFHSPEIGIGTNHTYTEDVKMRVVGITPVTAGITSHLLTLSTPTLGTQAFDLWENIMHVNVSSGSDEINLADYDFNDIRYDEPTSTNYYRHQTFPWHRSNSLGAQPSLDSTYTKWYGQPSTKIRASLKQSLYSEYFTEYDDSCLYDITQPYVCGGQTQSVMIPSDKNNTLFPYAKLYYGNVDTVLTPSEPYKIYGKAGDDTVSELSDTCTDPIRMRYKSSPHAVFTLKTDSALNMLIPPNTTSSAISEYDTETSLPFQIAGIISDLLVTSSLDVTFSDDRLEMTVPIDVTKNWKKGDLVLILDTDAEIQDIWQVKDVTWQMSDKFAVLKALDNDFYMAHASQGKYVDEKSLYGDWDLRGPAKFPKQVHDKGQYMVEYLAYYYLPTQANQSVYYRYKWYFKYYDMQAGEIKYYSYTYYVLHFFGYNLSVRDYPLNDNAIVFYWDRTYLMQNGYRKGFLVDNRSDNIILCTDYTEEITDTLKINQKELALTESLPYMYLAELYYDTVADTNMKDGVWNVAGMSVKTTEPVLYANIGDTYYQRYDCLKTCPYSPEDVNQIVEIFSFMCETRLNIDGRYDRLRGLADNTVVNDSNFNLWNPGYTQKDNFFTYSWLDSSEIVDTFPNEILWTGTKVYGSDVDSWTTLNALSSLGLSGDKGGITGLVNHNDTLYCFQNKGLAQIHYNERVSLTTEQGLPVELSNSGKVTGYTYISTNVGCPSPKALVKSDSGVWFADSSTKALYSLGSKGLNQVSAQGLVSYMTKSGLNIDSTRVFHDNVYNDVWFEMSNNGVSECLLYSERLGGFMSFMDIAPRYMFNYNRHFLAVSGSLLYRQFEGDTHLRFFDETDQSGNPVYKPYKLTILSNDKPFADKIFTNIEFTADVLSGGWLKTRPDAGTQTGQFDYASYNIPPFDFIRAWNEYQDTGTVSFVSMVRRGTNMSQKFRIWRADIPRNTKKLYPQQHVSPFERIRNPWTRITLSKSGGDYDTRIHNIAVDYV